MISHPQYGLWNLRSDNPLVPYQRLSLGRCFAQLHPILFLTWHTCRPSLLCVFLPSLAKSEWMCVNWALWRVASRRCPVLGKPLPSSWFAFACFFLKRMGLGKETAQRGCIFLMSEISIGGEIGWTLQTTYIGDERRDIVCQAIWQGDAITKLGLQCHSLPTHKKQLFISRNFNECKIMHNWLAKHFSKQTCLFNRCVQAPPNIKYRKTNARKSLLRRKSHTIHFHSITMSDFARSQLEGDQFIRVLQEATDRALRTFEADIGYCDGQIVTISDGLTNAIQNIWVNKDSAWRAKHEPLLSIISREYQHRNTLEEQIACLGFSSTLTPILTGLNRYPRAVCE